MGFCFDLNFKCCSCNKDTDLFKSTNLNYPDIKGNNDVDEEDNQKENDIKNKSRSKMSSSNESSPKNFQDSILVCPEQKSYNYNNIINI